MPNQFTSPRVLRHCHLCGVEIKVKPSKLKERNFCSHKCWADFRMSQKGMHPRYIGGRYITSRGYVRVNTEERGWMLEHRLVMEEYLSRRLKSHEQIHHISGDKADNRVANLQLLSQSEHMRIHYPANIRFQQAPMKPHGRWAKKHDECSGCGTTARSHAGHGLCSLCFQRKKKGVTNPYRKDVPLPD